jgi:uncharacterized membrane protein YedE/YeeE
MSRRKIFAIIALFGFIIGIFAQLAANYIVPKLSTVLASLDGLTQYILAGIAGAIITVLIILIWAHLTGKKDSYY